MGWPGGRRSWPRVRSARQVVRWLEFRPIGTNGYVSTWGANMGVRPPESG